MARPFFSMGPYKSRAAMSSSSTFGVGGQAFVPLTSAAFSMTSAASVAPIGTNATGWSAGSPVFHVGDGDTYDVAATGPVALGYVAGGTYDAASGTRLPSGLVLSAAGMITDTGAAADTTSGVVFGYNEPNALPILTLHSGAVSGTLPYMATIYLAEGAVPSGLSLESPEDSSLRGSVLSRWPDNSARVMVVAGHKTGVTTNNTVTLTLRPTSASDTPLTLAAITSKFTTGITVDFGGSRNLNTWTSPDLIWWANSQVICARYRLTCGIGVMEAVIDVHAFATGRALVEITIENSRLNPASPVKPTAQKYTGSVSVNGTLVKTINTGNIIRTAIKTGNGTITLTGITNANPAVFSYNNVAQADWMVVGYEYFGTLNIPSGMTELHGKEVRVVNISGFSGPNFQCEVLDRNARTWTPINSTTYGAFTSGTITDTGTPAFGTSLAHDAFRSWFCETWIGGDPQIEITHDAAYMQKLPCFDKYSAAATKDYSTWVPRGYFDGVGSGQPFGNDAYIPWALGRNSMTMGGVGDATGIGPLTYWDTHYVLSGSKHVRRAVIANALCFGAYANNYRSTATDMVVTHPECYGKTSQGSWPKTGYNFGREAPYGSIEVSHEPGVGLVGFLCRPSPSIIETAQKLAHVNAVADYSAKGIFGYWFAGRGRAWCFRQLAHAVWLTPTLTTGTRSAQQTAWATGAAGSLAYNVQYFREWDLAVEDKLNVMWDACPVTQSNYAPPGDHLYLDAASGGGAGHTNSIWFHHFLSPELHKAHNMKLLSGTDQTNLGLLADWAALQPVRYVNESPNGAWRYIGYRTVIGTVKGSNSTSIGQLADWGATRAISNPTNPPSVSGTFYDAPGNEPTTWSGWNVYTFVPAGGGESPYMYVPPFWAALCAAVERDVPGAATAWDTVMANVTNISTFMSQAADDPRHRFYPRNK